MKGLLRSVVAAAAIIVQLGVAAGCQTRLNTVVTLANESMSDTAATTRPLDRTIPAPVKGEYLLFSSKQPNTPIYQTDLKKGEPVGFRARGSVARGIAGGKIVELDDYENGASYEWKIEEKKKE